MDKEKKKAGIKELPGEYDFEKLLLEHYDFSPAELEEIQQVLDLCHELIDFHLDTTSSFSEGTKSKIAGMSLKRDRLALALAEISLQAGDFLKKVKKHKYFETKIDVDQKEIKQFNNKISEIRADTRGLALDLNKYFKMIEEEI